MAETVHTSPPGGGAGSSRKQPEGSAFTGRVSFGGEGQRPQGGSAFTGRDGGTTWGSRP